LYLKNNILLAKQQVNHLDIFLPPPRVTRSIVMRLSVCPSVCSHFNS